MTKDEYFEAAEFEYNKWLGGSEVLNTVEVIAKADYEAMKLVAVRYFSNRTLISTCSAYLATLQKAYAGKVIDVTMVDVLALLDDPALHIHGNDLVKFLYPPDLVEHHVENGLTMRRLSPEDSRAFEQFHNTCTEEEKEEGEVSLEDDIAVGCFDGEKLISVASYWFWGDVLADIGVLTDPAYRGKGIGKAVVCHLCKIGLEAGRINVYRHGDGNHVSGKLSSTLGFTAVVRGSFLSGKRSGD